MTRVLRSPAPDRRSLGLVAAGGTAVPRAAAAAAGREGGEDRDPEQGLRHHGQRRPGVGRGVHKVAPDVEVEVSGGGSGVGIAALDQGHHRHRQRQPQHEARGERAGEQEHRQGAARGSSSATTRSPSTSTRTIRSSEITLEQLAEIFAEGGTITRWSQLGVKIPGVERRHDRPRQPPVQLRHLRVLPRARARQEGLQARLARHERLQGGRRAGRQHADRHRLQRHGLRDPGGEDAASSRRRRRRGLREPDGGETVHDKTYPLARSLHVYTLGEPEGAVKEYIDWILSDAGQKIVEDSGYVPVPPEQRPKP